VLPDFLSALTEAFIKPFFLQNAYYPVFLSKTIKSEVYQGKTDAPIVHKSPKTLGAIALATV